MSSGGSGKHTVAPGRRRAESPSSVASSTNGIPNTRNFSHFLLNSRWTPTTNFVDWTYAPVHSPPFYALKLTCSNSCENFRLTLVNACFCVPFLIHRLITLGCGHSVVLGEIELCLTEFKSSRSLSAAMSVAYVTDCSLRADSAWEQHKVTPTASERVHVDSIQLTSSE
jgi:hypothetical protein